MRRIALFITSAAFLSFLAVGCAGDAVKTMLDSPEMQTKIMDAIAGNPTMTASMMSRFMGSDETRQMVVQTVMGNPDAMNAMMQHITRDPQMVEGFLSTAVQDSTMKAKIMDMVKGMGMAMRKKP
jgi:succinylglutamate desuccinylase